MVFATFVESHLEQLARNDCISEIHSDNPFDVRGYRDFLSNDAYLVEMARDFVAVGKNQQLWQAEGSEYRFSLLGFIRNRKLLVKKRSLMDQVSEGWSLRSGKYGGPAIMSRLRADQDVVQGLSMDENYFSLLGTFEERRERGVGQFRRVSPVVVTATVHPPELAYWERRNTVYLKRRNTPLRFIIGEYKTVDPVEYPLRYVS